MKTIVLQHTISNAAEVIRSGGVVAVPTETVYGLAADALSGEAVREVFRVKGRPENKPVSIFVTDIRMAERFCVDIPDAAYKLAERFWPGPVTLVLNRGARIPDEVTAFGSTVGVRCPDSALTLRLIEEASCPLTGTSANLSGEADIVTAEEALIRLGGRIPYIIDGGKCPGGVPSTVVDLTGAAPKILRAGAISEDTIMEALR